MAELVRSPGFVPVSSLDQNLVVRVLPAKPPVNVPLDPINFSASLARVQVAMEHSMKPPKE